MSGPARIPAAPAGLVRIALQVTLVLAFSGVATAQFVSDDFHACALDPSWTFIDPSGAGTAAIAGAYTGDARLLLGVPGGAAHEIWDGVVGAPHVRQALADADFTAAVRFLAAPAVRSGQEGLLVRQDDDAWLRLEFYRDDTDQVRAAMVGGPTTVHFDVPVPAPVDAPLCLRVERAGDTWTLAWSPDGAAWQPLGEPVVQPLHPGTIGIYAGNRGLAPAAHTVQVDWFGAVPGAGEDSARNTLQVAVDGGGLVTLAPERAEYACGEPVVVTALDRPGWVFSGWSGGLTGTENPVTVVMDGPRAFTAVFASSPTATLAVAARGGGTVQLSPPGGVYSQGATVTVTAIDSTGWTFDRWSGDLAGSPNPATVVMDADRSATAVFRVETVRTVTTAVEPLGAGVVTLDPPGGLYNQNTVVTVTAAPAPGWVFTAWTGDLDGAANPATLVADADRGVTAHFQPLAPAADDFNRCELGPPWVVVDPLGDGGGAVLEGGYTGQARLAISVPGGVAHEIWDGFLGAPHAWRPLPDADFTVEAKFDADLPVNFGQEGIVVRASASSWVRAEFLRDDAGRLRAALGLGPAGVAHDVFLPDGLVPPLWMRVTRSGGVFTQSWSADGAAWTVAGAPVAYAMQVGGVGVYAGNRGSAPPAHTVLVDYVTVGIGAPALEDAGLAPLVVEVAGHGAVARQPDLPSYACGQVAWLTATPSPGWAFVGWEGGAAGNANPLALTMTGPRSVVARFASLAAADAEEPLTRLFPCVPNPFNPRTVIAFDLAREGPVRAAVYAVDGRLVRVLADGPRGSGRHELAWEGDDDTGRRQASGVYLLRLTTPDGERTGRLVMLR